MQLEGIYRVQQTPTSMLTDREALLALATVNVEGELKKGVSAVEIALRCIVWKMMLPDGISDFDLLDMYSCERYSTRLRQRTPVHPKKRRKLHLGDGAAYRICRQNRDRASYDSRGVGRCVVVTSYNGSV